IGNVVAMTACSAVGAVFEDWQPVSLAQVAILTAGSALMCWSYFFSTAAMREGEISVLAPLRYSQLLFAAVLGYALWGDVPNLLASGGMVLMVVAGLFMIRLR